MAGLAVAASPAFAQGGGSPKNVALASVESPRSVFILPMSVVDLDNQALGEQVASWVADELGPRPEYDPVATQRELAQQLDAAETREILDCKADEACIARILEQTKADLIVSGTIGQIGRELILSLSVLDAKTATNLGRIGATASSPSALKKDMASLVGRLFRYEQGDENRFALPFEDHLRIGIFTIEATGVEEKVVKNLSQILAVELSQVRGAEIIAPEDIEAMLGAAKYRELVTGECDDECFVAISGSLNVAYIIVGQIGRLDSEYVLSLRLLDQKNLVVANRATETFRGPEEELKRAIRSLGRRVIGVEPKGMGTLAVSGPVSGARVAVGDRELGVVPIKSDEPFAAGRLELRITKPGYLDWQSDVFVQPGETNLVWAELKAAPKSIFERWWFWTAVGVLAAGGTAAGIVLSQQSPDDGTISVLIDNP